MVKILALSDVHCDTEKCKQLVDISANVDLVIGAGDFGNVRKGLDRTLSVLRHISKPFVIVPGNAESFEELEDACTGFANIHVLHGSGINLLNIPIYGIGGGIPVTPFGDWSYDFTESQAQELLADCSKNGILISHSPPKGAVDRTSSGKSIGSASVRDIIIERSIKLCICGHVHDCAGKTEYIEDTQIVNAGPHGVVLEFEI